MTTRYLILNEAALRFMFGALGRDAPIASLYDDLWTEFRIAGGYTLGSDPEEIPGGPADVYHHDPEFEFVGICGSDEWKATVPALHTGKTMEDIPGSMKLSYADGPTGDPDVDMYMANGDHLRAMLDWYSGQGPASVALRLVREYSFTEIDSLDELTPREREIVGTPEMFAALKGIRHITWEEAIADPGAFKGRIFNDIGMEGSGGGLLDQHGLIEDPALYDYYYQTTEDGESFWEVEPFMMRLKCLGFTHASVRVDFNTDGDWLYGIRPIDDYFHEGEWEPYLDDRPKDRALWEKNRPEAAVRRHPLFRDYEPNEPIWIMFMAGDDQCRIRAIAVEPPGDQTTFTFEPAPGSEGDWPLEWTTDDSPDTEGNPDVYHTIMASSEGLFEEDMDPMGPYPEVYGQMLWTWEHEGITFTTRPREVPPSTDGMDPPVGNRASQALTYLREACPGLKFISWDGTTLTVAVPGSYASTARNLVRKNGPWFEEFGVPVIVDEVSP